MLKCSMFFQLGIQGWSETWFLDSGDVPGGINKTLNLLTARLAMCPATVIGNAVRVSVDTNPNLFQALRLGAIVGQYTNTRDITNMALFWDCFTSANRRKQAITRGTPDDCVANGVYAPTPAFATAATTWKTTLTSNGFCIRTLDLSQALFDIVGVGATGILETFADHGWLASDKLKFFRSRTTTGIAIKKAYRIATKIDATHYQLIGWPAGRLVDTARVRKLAYLPTPMTDIRAVLATSRKTGRPFGQRAGRRRVATI